MRDCTPKDVARLCGIAEADDIVQAARWFAHVARADAVAVLPGPEPERRSGTAQERRADQPAPGHRPDRQARRRAVLADRPAQRDGRARGRRPGQPAVGASRPGQSRAPRRGRARCGASTTCRRSPARPRSRCSRRPPTARSRRCGSPAPTPRSRCPTRRRCARALERAEFVVVQEAFATTATCAYADLLLPATTWGEKDGTVTNSERRISRVRAAVPPPGEARDDWAIAADFARRLERAPARRGGQRRCSPTPTPKRSGTSTARRTRGRDLDITGLSYALLEARGPQQWPLPEGARAGHARASTRTASSRPPTAARASSTRRTAPPAEPRDARYPVRAHHRAPARPVARHEPHRHARPPVRPRRPSRRSR